MPTRPSSSASASASTLRGGRANLRNASVTFSLFLVPHSSLKCNSKFPVGMSKFPVQTRNFQLDKVEISSSNSKFPVGMSKFPV